MLQSYQERSYVYLNSQVFILYKGFHVPFLGELEKLLHPFWLYEIVFL